VNAKGHPSCIKPTLRTILEASHFKTKFLVKSGNAYTRFVEMASFKVEKKGSATSLQTKKIFLRSEVREVANFPHKVVSKLC
jgi:hypothetical protein